jgi:hypothetical protein
MLIPMCLSAFAIVLANNVSSPFSPEIPVSGFLPEAKWIGARRDGTATVASQDVGPLPIFRKEFVVAKPIKRAVISVAGLGQFELHVNGSNVTDTVMNPGWTNYRKTILYDRFDVTRLLKRGANALGVLLGNGMYNVVYTPGRYTKFTGSFGLPKLILDLHLEYKDGSSEDVVSDGGWKSAPGPVVFTSIYGGEDYDARLLKESWDMPGADGSGWSPVSEVSGPGGVLQLATNPPMKVFHVYPSVSKTSVGKNETVYDLAQNMSGWPVVKVSGKAGSTVKILPGELLDENGRVTQRSVDAGPGRENSFHYTLKGDGIETWKPRFSYHSFRYLQIETSEGVKVHSTAGEFIHADVPAVGEFKCSSDLFNRIHRLITMAMISNMASVVTDCPSREKLGWLEQTHLAASALMYNFDLSDLYQKVSGDMRDSQLDSGLVPSTAPELTPFLNADGTSNWFRDSPEWGSASILSPWRAYQFSGNLSALKEAYPTMQRYAAFLRSQSKDHLLMYGLGDWYDLGPGAPGFSQLTAQGLTPTAIYLEDLAVMEKVARLFGDATLAEKYASESAEVKVAFNAHFYHPDQHRYDRGSQTANAMPLVLGLVPVDQRAAVLDNLVADIRSHNNHVTAGDVGFHYVVRALTDGGRSDVLYDMLSRTDAPSYGAQLAHGATTLTEAWDANPASSQNHFMLGHADEWFYRGLAGIDFDRSRGDEKAIMIRPQFLPGLSEVSAEFHSSLGLIKSHWKRAGTVVSLSFTIPKGGVATVSLPGADSVVVVGGDHHYTVR